MTRHPGPAGAAESTMLHILGLAQPDASPGLHTRVTGRHVFHRLGASKSIFARFGLMGLEIPLGRRGIPMSNVTELASGRITAGDEISIELVEPSGSPAVILLRWPQAPSVTEPRRLGATCNAIMRVLAAAVAKLAEIRAEP
jgi:hypothetical protein